MKTPKPKRAKPNAKPNQQARTVKRDFDAVLTQSGNALVVTYRPRPAKRKAGK